MPRVPDAERDLEIVRMRRGGMSVGQIAYQLRGLGGYGDPTAEEVDQIVKRRAQEARDETAAIMQEQWWLGIERCEGIIRKITERLESLDRPPTNQDMVQLLKVLLNVQERLAKQLGLDKEVKSESWFGGNNGAAIEKIAAEWGIKPPESQFGKPAPKELVDA